MSKKLLSQSSFQQNHKEFSLSLPSIFNFLVIQSPFTLQRCQHCRFQKVLLLALVCNDTIKSTRRQQTICDPHEQTDDHLKAHFTVPSAVSCPFIMSHPFDAINHQHDQVVCKSNGRPNFINLHVLCHPGLHFRSLSIKCDVERTALSRGYSKLA
jgi:hypothetical protein